MENVGTGNRGGSRVRRARVPGEPSIQKSGRRSSRNLPRMSISSLPKGKSRQVGIGITSRDRSVEPAITLSELRMRGYEAVETIVIDAGSQRRLPEELRADLPKVSFERTECPLC